MKNKLTNPPINPPSGRRANLTRYIVLGTLYFVLVTFSACKIRYSFTGGDKGNAKTVQVNFFKVDAPLAKPTTGIVFTEALKDIMQNQGKLELITTTADLSFEGQITGYAITPVAIQSNDQSALNRLTITVQVKYTNTLEKEKSFDQSFSRFTDYESSKNLSSVEDELITEIVRQLVQDIFNRSLSNW